MKKSITEFITKYKINILFTLFVISLFLLFTASFYYQNLNLKKIEINQKSIQTNYGLIQSNQEKLNQRDTVFKILLKNDSIILEKLEK